MRKCKMLVWRGAILIAGAIILGGNNYGYL